ncbi:glycoside hydrolase family 3 N-terminal domain-containing protein [Microbacterium aquilitoris]|uniref:beta-N-acetylhexosaminidase n=1 Tax=Microbacterium aquilitoris TaxID=3067307 RepID=A0ABU3GFW1_9MICO|nr:MULTISPECIES: glycoside hydrolase family 3 N-terminal domain-containing protein [unclassified Microbacterium]MDT3329592.1 glycoside hydrolase family 3 N-terminal domain-containing protein [Microbacterium sp. KSW-18]MDT3345424.1 glycoside hydrolase family 3 N-terminal domain-containing protein [Microbacterium sp. KSW2-22]
MAASILAGCAASPTGSSSPSVAPSPGTSPSAPSPATSPSAVPSPSRTPDPIDALSLEQRVGQLFMVGTPATTASPATLAVVRDRHAGGIFLSGRSHAGVSGTAEVVARFTALDHPEGVPLWVATDQEGGEVQVLRGPGFDAMPYGIRQADLPSDQLQARAEAWGRELADAGVNLDLAPVADIVTSEATRFDNPPIGGYGRQYGYDASTVADKAGAFADGMRDAGILPTFKHFPGLGHVSANTDTTADVVDRAVTPDGPDVDLYRPLTAAGPSAVMVSSAIYDRIDGSTPAVFSPKVVGLLRSEVGFDGVVFSDDLSGAVAVSAWSPADRAVRAISAGVDVVLVSAKPSVFPAMYDAVLAKAKADPQFAAQVDAAAARVLAAKAEMP